MITQFLNARGLLLAFYGAPCCSRGLSQCSPTLRCTFVGPCRLTFPRYLDYVLFPDELCFDHLTSLFPSRCFRYFPPIVSLICQSLSP